MSISRFGAVIVSVATTASLVAATSSSTFAAEPLDAPLVLSADLMSAAGAGCSQPAVRLGDGTLDVEAQTGGDTSLLLDGGQAVGESSASVECVLQVHVQLDQPARIRAS